MNRPSGQSRRTRLFLLWSPAREAHHLQHPFYTMQVRWRFSFLLTNTGNNQLKNACAHAHMCVAACRWRSEDNLGAFFTSTTWVPRTRTGQQAWQQVPSPHRAPSPVINCSLSIQVSKSRAWEQHLGPSSLGVWKRGMDLVLEEARLQNRTLQSWKWCSKHAEPTLFLDINPK